MKMSAVNSNEPIIQEYRPNLYMEMFQMHFSVVREKLKFIFPKSNHIYNRLNEHYCKSCIKILTESNFLNDEDQHVIETDFPQQTLVDHNFTTKNGNSITLESLFRFGPLYAAIVACFVSLFMPWGNLLPILTIIFPLMFYIKLEIQQSMWKHLFEKNLTTLKTFVQQNQNHLQTIQKSLQFIHDSEVVSMGYTMLSAKVTLASKLDQSRIRSFKECVKLRHCIFTATTKALLAHRDLAQKIIEETNDKSQTSYVCQLPLTQLGPCFDTTLSKEELIFATDSFCLAVLRDLNKFLFQQRSELIRIILINRAFSFSSFENCCEVVGSEQSSLEKLYECFYNYENDLSNKTEDCKKANSNSKKHKPLLSAVRSVQMHLRSSLSLYINIQELLENDKDVGLNELTDTDILTDILKENLAKIRMHSESSAFCYEEILKHTDKLSGVEDMELGETPKRAKLDETANEQDAECIMLDTDGDFVEDQIFEGETNDADTMAKENFDEICHIGGKRKRDQESRDVIRELASVLHIKTSDEHREMVKSKLFPRYKPHTRSKAPLSSNNVWHNTPTDLLKVPRRPKLPRKQRFINRKIKFKTSSPAYTNKTDDIKSWEIINKDSIESEPPRMGLGVGFSSAMAAQAAAMASRFGRNTEDDIINDVIGSDDDL